MSYEQISFEDLAIGNVAPDAPAEEPKKTKTSSKKKEETNVAEDKKGKGGLHIVTGKQIGRAHV